jgi:hypothetical protein
VASKSRETAPLGRGSIQSAAVPTSAKPALHAAVVVIRFAHTCLLFLMRSRRILAGDGPGSHCVPGWVSHKRSEERCESIMPWIRRWIRSGCVTGLVDRSAPNRQLSHFAVEHLIIPATPTRSNPLRARLHGGLLWSIASLVSGAARMAEKADERILTRRSTQHIQPPCVQYEAVHRTDASRPQRPPVPRGKNVGDRDQGLRRRQSSIASFANRRCRPELDVRGSGSP